MVLLGTFRETHWELVRDMRNLLRTRGTYWKRHWEQNENRMGTKKSKKMGNPTSATLSVVGFMDKTRLGLGFLVQKRTVSSSLGCSIWAERRFHKSKACMLRGKIREKEKFKFLVELWNEAWKRSCKKTGQLCELGEHVYRTYMYHLPT